jgi:uncharacterized protein involved in type VI secretion and phage assembly
MSITDALSSDKDGRAFVQPQSNLILARVTNVTDPDNVGRIKCKPLTAGEEPEESEWCYRLAPWGSDGSGAFVVPNVGDLVVLAYLFGEITRPVILGSVLTGTAPNIAIDGSNETTLIKSKNGLEIKLNQKRDSEKLTLTTSKGATVILDDIKGNISLSDKDGKTSITMDTVGGSIELKAKTKLIFSAGDTNITLNSSGSADISSKASLKVESASVEIKGKNTASVNAGQVEVKAQGQLAVQAGGLVNIKGSMVKIN